jgi:hypothetical protein
MRPVFLDTTGAGNGAAECAARRLKGQDASEAPCQAFKAFSSEAVSGSREENAQKQNATG